MELDELKKSWNALDAQLQKEPIADEKQIKELIANYKTNTRHSLGRLVILQRFSLGTGAVTILSGMWWDWKTYLWNKNTHIDEMSVAEVSRRMTRFRNWTRYEIWAVAAWTVIFTILFFWIMDYYTLPLMVQAVLIGCYIILDALLIYFIYKKVVYKHLDSIKKNIEELKDICTE